MVTQYAVPEAATREVLWKKMFLEISQNSQENTCELKRLFFNKVAGLRLDKYVLIMNALISIGISDIYLKVTIKKNGRSQNFDFLDL